MKNVRIALAVEFLDAGATTVETSIGDVVIVVNTGWVVDLSVQ